MLALIVRRLVSLIPILLIVSFVVFMLTELVPGDAATTLAGGADATPERVAEVRTQLGLDRPVLERYGDWLVDAVQLDFGSSLLNQSGPTIAEEIRVRIPVTFSARARRPLREHADRDTARDPLGHTPRSQGRPRERHRDEHRSRDPELRRRAVPHHRLCDRP